MGDQQLRQPLTILKDPNSGGSAEEITAQTAFMTDVTSDLNTAVDMINALEVVRSQVAVIKASTVRLLRNRVREIRAQFDQVMSRNLEAYKALLRQRNIQHVIIS